MLVICSLGLLHGNLFVPDVQHGFLCLRDVLVLPCYCGANHHLIPVSLIPVLHYGLHSIHQFPVMLGSARAAGVLPYLEPRWDGPPNRVP